MTYYTLHLNLQPNCSEMRSKFQRRRAYRYRSTVLYMKNKMCSSTLSLVTITEILDNMNSLEHIMNQAQELGYDNVELWNNIYWLYFSVHG